MKRGDIVTVAMTGDYGKPRPAVVIQSDLFDDSESVLVCQVTTDATKALFRRIPIKATPESGLATASQIMVEKIFAVRRTKCRKTIGRIDAETIEELNEALALVIGLAD